MNTFTEIDLEHWHRREQFRYYRTFENQLFNITLEFHAKKLYRFAKERGESFFLRTLHAILRAVDATPQMRMRVLDDGRLVEFEHLAALSPILRPDREFTMALCEYADRFRDFIPGAAKAVAAAKEGQFDPAIRQRNDYLCASCLPSVHFLALSQAALRLDQTIVILAWGGMDRRGRIPLSLQLNHSLVDGAHVAAFAEALEELLDRPESL